jgi:hypothetical protein
MPENAHSPEQWTPASAADRDLVLKELDAILASYHFRGSKRYPALLKYVVSAALDGHAGDLKERTLGVEVFGRDPEYDTSADPVVRFSASEVRKRIAQYYHEQGDQSGLQIEMPLGSYVPEFFVRGPGSAAEKNDAVAGKSATSPNDQRVSRRRYRAVILAMALLLVAVAAAGIFSYRRLASRTVAVDTRLWDPLFKSPRPILIVFGASHPNNLGPEAAETSFFDHTTGPYHHVSIATATALANLAGVLREHGAVYEIKEDTETSLTDLHARPVILVGATNNAWTMRLVSTLRYRFTPVPLVRVLDSHNPQNSDWLVDFSKPYTAISTDYAIVARYQDATTEGPVLVVAGLGPYGTEAASAFVSAPEYMEQIVKQAPVGWENKNLEMVIKSEVIDGKAGPPVLVTSIVW